MASKTSRFGTQETPASGIMRPETVDSAHHGIVGGKQLLPCRALNLMLDASGTDTCRLSHTPWPLISSAAALVLKVAMRSCMLRIVQVGQACLQQPLSEDGLSPTHAVIDNKYSQAVCGCC